MCEFSIDPQHLAVSVCYLGKESFSYIGLGGTAGVGKGVFEKFLLLFLLKLSAVKSSVKYY